MVTQKPSVAHFKTLQSGREGKLQPIFYRNAYQRFEERVDDNNSGGQRMEMRGPQLYGIHRNGTSVLSHHSTHVCQEHEAKTHLAFVEAEPVGDPPGSWTLTHRVRLSSLNRGLLVLDLVRPGINYGCKHHEVRFPV